MATRSQPDSGIENIERERKEQKFNAKYKESAFLRDGFSNWKKAREKLRDHQMSQCHKMAVENVIVLPKTCSDIGEMLDMTLGEEKKESRSNMSKIIENLQFLARQGLALQGHSDEESNFIQLYHLRVNDNSKMIEWLKKETNRYHRIDHQGRDNSDELDPGQLSGPVLRRAGSRRGVAEQILKDAPKAHYTHCHGHALNVAVCDATKGSKLLADTLDITYEICKLIKFSPKRQSLLEKIKANINLETAGLKVICPIRWTFRGQSFDRIIANYEALLLEWDVCLEDRLDSEMRARIIGVRSQMEKFEYFFALHLGVAVYSLTDNLLKTLPKTCMSAAQGQQNAKLVAGVLDKMRNDSNFDKIYEEVHRKAMKLNISEPQMPRQKREPKRFEVGTGEPSFPSSPKEFYRRQYFEVLDLAINAINRRFDQPVFQTYRHMEDLLFKSLREEDTPDELK
ncbi:zinc finger MYM-type protein 1-like [Tachypleus tridentatus]|uniref:zinc finger MYM-type protein 1-like n=1 Tax=Tachypleus tridentatus TaxID=6853 RepID=UPI003FD49630